MTDDETTQVPDALLEALAGLEGVEGPAAERATDDGMPTGMDLEARAEADPRSRIELIVAIDAVEAQRDEYLDDLRRSHADFENYRKRVARDGAIQREHGRSDVVTVLLDVLDDLDRVVAAADALTDTHAAEVTAVASGVRVVAEKAQRVLEGLGIERVDAAGRPVRPDRPRRGPAGRQRARGRRCGGEHGRWRQWADGPHGAASWLPIGGARAAPGDGGRRAVMTRDDG